MASSASAEPCRAHGTMRGCARGDSCKFAHVGAIGDATRARLKTLGGEICKAWQAENGCRYGKDCPRSHEGPGHLFREKSATEKATEQCRGWSSVRGCAAALRGDKCPYKHDGKSGLDTRAELASRPAEVKAAEDCLSWISERGCARDNCPYKHDAAKCGNPNPVKRERPVFARGGFSSRGGRGGSTGRGGAPSGRGNGGGRGGRQSAPAAAAAAAGDSKCRYYNSESGCKNGASCRFSHE